MTCDYRIYKHNPPHLFKPNATYMITAATYKRQKLFIDDSSMGLLLESLFHYFKKYDWHIKSYVILPNHYHVIALASNPGYELSGIIRNMHSYTANQINKIDSISGRRVWWNYWDTCITHRKSCFARINYIHHNPVTHGYVADPSEWLFSSFRSFHEHNYEEAVRIEKEYPFNRVNVKDDF